MWSVIDWAWIDAIGLGYVGQMPHIRSHMTMLTTLIERWRSETMTFHLPMGDITVTVEDVCRIYNYQYEEFRALLRELITQRP